MKLFKHVDENEILYSAKNNVPKTGRFIDFAQTCRKEIKKGIMMYALPDSDFWMSLPDLFDYWESAQ